MMDDIAASAGVKLHRTPVGEANVAVAVNKYNCVLGGEGNGGVIDPRVVLVRDSFAGIALMLNFLADTDKTVSELAADLPKYEMHKDKFPCPPEAAEKILTIVRETFSSRAGAKINDADGLRVDLPEGWLHVRASNTEPIMRIITEARDANSAGKIAEEVRKIAEGILQ
jgi:phosphomannomutase